MKTCCLGQIDYLESWRRMRAFTDSRQADTDDEIWVCEHPPVYTLGQAGRKEHLLAPGCIPVVQTDRGGQVTYHGPGQVVVYTLLNLRRAGYGIREMVIRLENSVIDLLAEWQIAAAGRRDAPGVYVDGAKIAALGLRVRKGCTYHGIALNVHMDLTPFDGIDPCGYRGLEVTSLRKCGVQIETEDVAKLFIRKIKHNLSVAGKVGI